MSSTASASHPLGRDAHKPTDIPTPGWKEILIRVYKEFTKDRVLLVAAGVTFYLLLAMVPAMTAFISMYGLFADPASAQQHVGIIQDFLPGGGQEIIGEQLTRLSEQPNTGLGIALVISLGVALWSTNAGMKALFEAMNVAYDEAEKRGFIKLTLISLAFTVGAIVMLLAIIAVVVVMPMIVQSLGLGALTELFVKVGSAVVLLAAGLVGLSALYRWGPSREQAEWKWITPGAVVAVVIAMIGSLLFSYYVSNFGSYNETYGSLGAIIGFMTWLWIMMIFVVTGGELNAEMEHQTSKDTTTGAEEPMGARGALMADNVAQGPDDPGESAGSDGAAHGSPAAKQAKKRDSGNQAAARAGSGSDAGAGAWATRKRDTASHRDVSGTDRVGTGTTRHLPQSREPLGITGGLLLLGAVVMAVAAGNSGRSGGHGSETRLRDDGSGNPGSPGNPDASEAPAGPQFS